MSGVYIPMEMPDKGEFKHIRIYDNGDVTVQVDEGEAVIAHAVPVPEHGRTIDADAFKKRMMQGAIDAREDALTDEIWLHILDAAKSLCLDIDEQPTVIPADPADKEVEG